MWNDLGGLGHTFRVKKNFGYGEVHGIELFGIYDIRDRGLLFQPKLTLSPDDAFEIEMGVILFAGKEESIFGRFDNNDEVYLKGTYSF